MGVVATADRGPHLAAGGRADAGGPARAGVAGARRRRALAGRVRAGGRAALRCSSPPTDQPPWSRAIRRTPAGGDLAEACIALRDGADWVACNVDSTLPTRPGAASGQRRDGRRAGRGDRPATAGRRQAGTAAAGRGDPPRRRRQTPLVVGDRLDTDIACAHAAGHAEPAGAHRSVHRRRSAGRAARSSARRTWPSTCAGSSRRTTRSRSRPRTVPGTSSGPSGWTAACSPSPRCTRRRTATP